MTFKTGSEEVRVHLPIVILIVQHRNGERPRRQVLEGSSSGHGVRIDVYTLLPHDFGRVIGKTLRVSK